jgi:uncharacterized protein (TIGR00251 family)
MAPPPETRLTVEVRPRAGRSGIAGWHGAVLRLRVAAPPADGAANEAVRALLAERLGCARSRVEIVRGHAARTKIVRIAGLAPAAALARLEIPGAAPPRRPASSGT